MKFDDFTGLFVMHCHRLNHEDNGLMTLVNVIPAVSTYAVAVPGSAGHAAEVKVYDGNGDRLLATVTPFPGFEGTPAWPWAMSTTTASRPGRRRRKGPRAGGRRLLGKGERRQGPLRDRARPLRGFRSSRARRRQRDLDADRRLDRRQHHRRLGSGHPQRSQGLPREAAVGAGHGARAVLDLQPLSRRSQRA